MESVKSWACGENVVFDMCTHTEGDKGCYGKYGGVHATGPARSSGIENVKSLHMSEKNSDLKPAIIFASEDCSGKASRVDFIDDPIGGTQWVPLEKLKK